MLNDLQRMFKRRLRKAEGVNPTHTGVGMRVCAADDRPEEGRFHVLADVEGLQVRVHVRLGAGLTAADSICETPPTMVPSPSSLRRRK